MMPLEVCDLDGVAGVASGEDGGVGAEVDGRGADGCEECDGELAGVEAVLVEEDEAVVGGYELRGGDERGLRG